MLAAERRDVMLARLQRDGRLVTKDLAAEFGVAVYDVARDLRELAAAGLCRRVYGGALPVTPAPPVAVTRVSAASVSRRRVATAAVRLVRPGSTLLLDGGPTALAVVRALPADLPATVVTHSPSVAAALVDHPIVDVYVLGGRLFKPSGVTCGAAAADAARAVHADVFLLSVQGVHPHAGLTVGDVDEAAMKRLLAARAADTYVLAGIEELGAAAPFVVLPLTGVSGIVADASSDHPALQDLERAGTRIITAS